MVRMKEVLYQTRSELGKKYRTLLRNRLNTDNRRNLINRDFSLISSNCVGGVISHDLGLQFKSPTINLFLYPDDYLKLIYNLKYYLNSRSMKEDRKASEEYGHPVGILEDIRLYFGHYDDFEYARNKWFERCQRVNYNNLYFMMIQRDGCTEADLSAFDQFPSEHKVVFTTEERPDIKCSYHIPGSVSSNHQVIDLIGYKSKITGRRWIDDFDYVHFLNQ